MRSFAFLTWICVLAAPQAWAQAGRPLTPDEAVSLGLEHSARLEAARADAVEARSAYRQARAARLPSISAQAGYTRLSSNIPEIDFTLPGLGSDFTLAPVELDRYYSELSVDQPLFTGFRVHNQIAAAEHLADAAAFLAEQEQVDVAFEIRRAYWRLYGAVAALDAVRAALAHVEAHLADVENFRQAGAALQSDVLAAHTRRSEVLFERLEAENDVQVARLELNRLVGLPLETQIEPAAEIEIEQPSLDADSVVARALEARPAIKALAEEVRANEDRVDAARGSWLPELALSGRYVYARPNQYFFLEQDQFNPSWEAGVALRWNIWDGGQRSAEISAARARAQAAKARLDDVRQNVAVDATKRYLEVRRASKAAALAEQIVAQAEETFRMLRLQFEEGVALSADVLDAERALRSARARRAQAVAEYAVSRAALLNGLGEVW